MFGEEGVERGEVSGFLVVHVFHEGAEVWVGGDEGWSLGGVDEGSGEFAGVINAKRRLEVVLHFGG